MQIMTGLVGESVWKVNRAPDCALAELNIGIMELTFRLVHVIYKCICTDKHKDGGNKKVTILKLTLISVRDHVWFSRVWISSLFLSL